MVIFQYLKHLFSSTESLEKDVLKNKNKLADEFLLYLISIPIKDWIIKQSFPDLVALQEILKEEIKLVLDDEDSEDKILEDLKSIEHRFEIRKIHRLEQTLNYDENKSRYVYELLKKSFHAIKKEVHLLKMLTNSLHDRNELLKYLKEQIQIEMAVAHKIAPGYDLKIENKVKDNLEKIPTQELLQTIKEIYFSKLKSEKSQKLFFNFTNNTNLIADLKSSLFDHQDLFIGLIKCEHIIKELTHDEKKMFAKMEPHLKTKDEDSFYFKWFDFIYSTMDEYMYYLNAEGLLNSHKNADFEFVNSFKFEEYVKLALDEALKEFNIKLIPGDWSEDQWIKAVVHSFREDFNSVYKNYRNEF